MPASPRHLRKEEYRTAWGRAQRQRRGEYASGGSPEEAPAAHGDIQSSPTRRLIRRRSPIGGIPATAKTFRRRPPDTRYSGPMLPGELSAFDTCPYKTTLFANKLAPASLPPGMLNSYCVARQWLCQAILY